MFLNMNKNVLYKKKISFPMSKKCRTLHKTILMYFPTKNKKNIKRYDKKGKSLKKIKKMYKMGNKENR